MTKATNTEAPSMSPSAATCGSVGSGEPPRDWEAAYKKLEGTIRSMEAAANIMHDHHRETAHCEHPRTCGGCHFWSGAAAACRDLRIGETGTIKKAMKLASTVKDSLTVPDHSELPLGMVESGEDGEALHQAATQAYKVLDHAMQTLLGAGRISVYNAQIVDNLHQALNGLKRALSQNVKGQ